MIKLNDLSIRAKFSIPLLTVGLLIILVSLFNINNSKRLSAEIHLLSTTLMNAIATGLNADRDLYQALAATQNYVTKSNLGIDDTQQDRQDFEENARQALDRMNEVRQLMANYPEVTEAVREFDSDYQAWFDAAEQVFAMADNGDTTKAATFNSTEVMAHFDRLRSHYDVLEQKVMVVAESIAKDARTTGKRELFMLTTMIIVVVLGIAVSVVFGPRLITNRVHALNAMIATISEGEGDLRGRLDCTGKDELSKLAKTFNGLMEKLQQLVSAIKHDADTLDKAVVNLNDSAVQSQSISQEQNSNLEQIATAVNELSYAVHEIARNSQSALNETQEAKDKSAQATSVVEQSVSGIGKLSESVRDAQQVIARLAEESKNIVTVLNVIRDIADQTNLLALNAAIEAARAGDQGRGFAVVADEVRTLASRTQDSTEDIQRMIAGLEMGVSKAVNAIEAGTNQMDTVVQMSGRITSSLESVGGAVTNINDMIYQMATATEEQSKVVDEINRNTSLMNNLAQRSLQIVSDTKQVSHQIASMAAGLNGNVGRFKV